MQKTSRSADLHALIRERIRDQDGWLDFEDFMQLALHEPGLGYYATSNSPVGAGGDFITAPETGDLFAQCIANYLRHNLPPGGSILELGPGTGTLASGILTTLTKNTKVTPEYLLLETSPGLRQRQKETLDQAGWATACTWLTRLPDNFTGIIIGNEVLDALPCRALSKHNGNWRKRGVGLDTQGAFTWVGGPAAAQEDCERLAKLPLPDGYCLEINRRAEALVATLASNLATGLILLIDYGFPRNELYHPQRSQGSLMSHARHRSSTEVLAEPGSHDMTAHVDFSAMAQAGIAAGAQLTGYTTQAAFLLDLGIATKAEEDAGDLVGLTRHSRQLQTLLMPSEMGELFKVLALARNHSPTGQGFHLRNRAGELLGSASA